MIETMSDCQCWEALKALFPVLRSLGIPYGAMCRAAGFAGTDERDTEGDVDGFVEGVCETAGAREGLALLLNRYVTNRAAARFLAAHGATPDTSGEDSDDAAAEESQGPSVEETVYVAERVPLAQLAPSPSVERLRQGSTVVGLLCPDDGAPGHDPMTCDYVHRRRE